MFLQPSITAKEEKSHSPYQKESDELAATPRNHHESVSPEKSGKFAYKKAALT